jgi:hypothetical protein
MMDSLWLAMGNHWFWFLLTAACVLWYSTITVYVAIRGAIDIKDMLGRLGENERERNGSKPTNA